MTKAKILVNGLIDDAGITRLKKYFVVTYNPALTDREWMLAHLGEYDGLLLASGRADQKLIDAGVPRLKIITTHGVGFDHVDIKHAKKRGIVVTNCPASVRLPTAEMALTLMLAVTRRIGYYDRQLRQGKWVNVSQPANMGTGLNNKVLGIYGMGRIGSTLAQLVRPLGMTVIYHNRHQLPQAKEQQLGAQYVDFMTLLRTADVISLHAPATATTQGVFDQTAFRAMKKTAYLINTARGALVNQDDLITALREGEIAGAGLDVFADEPTIPAVFQQLDNVVLTPHAGTGTHEARAAIATEAADNLITYLLDGQAANQVN